MALAVDPRNPLNVYVGVWDGYSPSGGTLLKSTDGAVSLIEAKTGLPADMVMALAVDPQVPSNVYAGTITGLLFRSTDAGRSWSPLETGRPRSHITALAVGPALAGGPAAAGPAAAPSILYVATYMDGVIALRP